MAREPDLDAAYALGTAEQHRRLYGDWAQSYDAGFAARLGYRLPALVAAAFAAAGGRGPVLDAGAGTGLLGAALADLGVGPVDGVDLSPAMLDVARGRGCYRRLEEADLTAPLPPGRWAGLVSSGTFTLGHLGPKVLIPLVAALEPGAVVALSVNEAVWSRSGYEAVLGSMKIRALSVAQEPIYDRPDPGHAGDRARIVTFRTR